MSFIFDALIAYGFLTALVELPGIIFKIILLTIVLFVAYLYLYTNLKD